MSLLQRLTRPLARFLRFEWMARLPLWPAGLSSAPARKRREARQPTRLEGPVPCEPRECPDDILGVLTSQFALGGLPLLAGQFVTPFTAFLQGWGHQAPLPAPSGSAAVPAQQPTEGPARPPEMPAPLLPERREGEALRPPAPVAEAPRAGAVADGDWLNAVGAFLDAGRPSRPPAAPGELASPPSGGGGGGGGVGGGGQPIDFTRPAGPAVELPRGGAAGDLLLSGSFGPAQPRALAGPSDGGTNEGGAALEAGGRADAGGLGGEGAGAQGRGEQERASQPALASGYGRSQLGFEINRGQAGDESVVFLSRGPGLGLWLTRGEVVFGVPRPPVEGQERSQGRDVFRMNLVGTSGGMEVVGREQLHARSNYFTGDDPSKWLSNVEQFGRVEYRGAWQGVDIAFHSRTPEDRVFEYDFHLAPGAEASAVRLRWSGLEGMRVDGQGRLLLRTGGGEVVQEAPVLYQEDGRGGREYVPGRYRLLENGDVGFEVTGSYDHARTLVIDPAISFASYLGGSGTDKAYGVAVDAAGNSYVAGETASSDFPAQDGYDATLNATDAFLTKVRAQGDEVVFSTFLGGTYSTLVDPPEDGGLDWATAVALGLDGSAYLAGVTYAEDFPATAGAYKTAYTAFGAGTGFVAKLAAAGDALAFATYFGVDGTAVNALAVDSAGSPYLTGVTNSGPGNVFPTTAGAFDTSANGGTEAFATKLTPTGSTLVYSTFLGGSSADAGYGIAVDSSGGAFVAGQTASTNFPTSSAYQGSRSGASDAFLVQLSAAGTALGFGTYLGGTGAEAAYAVALGKDGKPHLTGSTTSTDFPTVSGARQTASGGGTDAFLTAFTASGATLSYSTYYGGSGTDIGYGIAVDAQGRATVAGSTTSTNLPTYTAFQAASGGGTDAFLARVTTTGTLSYASYIGGGSTDEARAVALDPRGLAYPAGLTNSSDLPVTSGAYQASNQGGYDAWLAKVFPDRPDAPKLTAISSDSGASATDEVTTDQTLTLSGTAGASVTVTLERAGVGALGSVLSSVNGTWSYDYTGTTLSEGSYAFTARATDSNGAKSDYSAPEFLVHVDRSGPTVGLTVPSSTPSRGPEVHVTARDRYGVSATATVAFDVDLDNDGNFTDGGEPNYASGTLTDGQAIVKLPTLSGTGTYRVQARVLDLAGNEGTSSASTFTVTANTNWTATARVLSADPGAGDSSSQLGGTYLTHALDLDRSPGTQQAGSPALVYDSTTVSVKPIVQVSLPSANNASLPANVTTRLSFDLNGDLDFLDANEVAATVTYSTSGFAPGDVFTLALQAAGTVGATGRYGYSVLIQVSGQADQNVTGSTFVVARDGSELGAGWSFAGVDRLVDVASDANGPAGKLRVYGSGGWRFYQGTSTFTSPTGDNGTLATAGGGGWTYTTPDGQVVTFNSSGYMTGWKSADANELITSTYDGSNRLSTITAIDGGLTTLTYTGSSSVELLTVNSRRTTLTLSSGDLTSIKNADDGLRTFSYDGSTHRLTREQFGAVENNWAYTSAGTLGTFTWGATIVNDVTNTSRTVLSPAVVQGLGTTPVSGTVWASATDPTAHVTRTELDERGRVLQALSAEGARTQYAYTSGYVTKETDPLNRVTTFTRDGSGYVTKTELPDGSVITYQYQSAFHALTTVTNERGYTTTYAYDGSGHLTRMTDALGNHTTYAYTGGGVLESVKDARGNVTTSSYDASRRLSGTQDALGNRMTVTYDANGNVETVKDALNRVTTFVSDSMGRQTVSINALGYRNTVSYDVSGLALTTTDPLLKQTSTVYDAFKRGLVAQGKDGVGSAVPVSSLSSYDDAGRTTSSRNANGWSSDTSYGPDDQALVSTDALGGTTASYYDLVGQLLASRDELGRWTEYGYDSRGRQVTVKNALGYVTTSAYDQAGNLTASTDALGRTTTYAYDALGRQTGTLDALLRRTTVTFDAVGNVATRTDPLARVTSYAYDALNRATTVTEAVGTSVQRTSVTAYDEVGNVKAVKDALGDWATYSFDALNRTTEVQNALGHRVTTTYDAVGQVVTVKDALSRVVTYGYDALHRQVTATDPLSHVGTTVLDALGQQSAGIDALGNVGVSAIDALGRGVASVDALGGVPVSSFDGSGALRLFTDPVGNEWRYAHDGLGREAVRFDPAGAATTTAYDAVGRVTQETDRLGRSRDYSYDAGDRLTAVAWRSAAGVTVNLITYAYDANDNRTSAADSSGTVTYTFDELNRAKTYTNVFGQVLTYTFDAEGRATLREDSLGGVLTSVYDAAGRLTSRQFGGSGQTPVRIDFGYTNRDEMSSKTWFTDLAGTTVLATSAYAYDDAGRLTGITNKNASAATLSYYNYGYDNADRVSVHAWWSQVGTVVYSGTNTYSYDTTSQLTDDSATAYSYDLNGNRTMAGYQTGSANRMSNDGTFTYTYDTEGNLTQKSKGASLETWYYAWDNANRLTSVRKTSDGSTNTLWVTYTYDVEGQLAQEDKWKTGVGNTTVRHAFDGANHWADLDGSNVVQVRYVFADGMDEVLTRTVASGGNAGLWAYAPDRLGSIRDLINSSGQVQDHIDYGGFGSVAEVSPTIGDYVKFTGRWLDPDTELANYRARWYQLSTGRWLSEDPILFEAGDTNLTRYVGNCTFRETMNKRLQGPV